MPSEQRNLKFIQPEPGPNSLDPYLIREASSGFLEKRCNDLPALSLLSRYYGYLINDAEENKKKEALSHHIFCVGVYCLEKSPKKNWGVGVVHKYYSIYVTSNTMSIY